MFYVALIPILLILVYGGFRFYKNYTIHTFWVFAIIIGILIASYFLSMKFYTQNISLLITIVIESLLLFFILHLINKVSYLLVLVYLLISSGILFLGIKYPDTALYLLFLSSMIFFMTEDNQIFMKKTYEQAASDFQNKILDKQISEVQNIYLVMRGWRHDYHNHLQTLKAQISMDKIKEASIYLNELEIDLDQVNQLVESGNINLDAILNSKISLALKNNISVTYKALVPPKLTISDIDLCVLIGNLIDNAVEACEKITRNQNFIRIYIGVFKKQLYISISNATNEIVRKLDEEYITTKRGNHGHGLKRINLIVDKYNGYVNRKNEPGVFVTEVMLPL